MSAERPRLRSSCAPTGKPGRGGYHVAERSQAADTVRVEPPDVQYAKSGDVNIAYQVTGDGPFDLVFVPGYVTHLELHWAIPSFTPFLEELASFCRLIRFDKRGTGMSDRVSGAPSMETRMDDARAVMDAVGSSRAAFYGLSEGAADETFCSPRPTRSAPRRSSSVQRLSAQECGHLITPGRHPDGGGVRA